MHARLPSPSGRSTPHPLIRLVRVVVLLLPLALVLMAVLRQTTLDTPFLWLGISGQALVCLLAVWSSRMGSESSSTVVILLYVIALGCLVVGATGHDDWLAHISRSVLLVV